jgi:Gram-negative bacterial TonB protein C-terminal
MKCAAHILTVVVLLAISSTVVSANDSLAELPKKSLLKSQITSPGSRPFVLKAKVLESTNPSNEGYKAEIEEYWFAPDKWRRTVKSSAFSQTLIVNEGKTSEQITGEYYPNWLRTIVDGIFEPETALKGVDLSRSSDNPVLGGKQTCRRFTFMAGIAPVSNKVFSSFCFEDGLLSSVFQPGYHLTYKNYKKFAGKPVARTISEYIEPGTELESTIEELSELNAADESQFAIQQTNAPVQTVRTDEASLRNLAVSAPDIVWPSVRSGATQGTLSLYVCLDRTGRVREIYELNSSNAGLSDFAREQVMKWQFKRAQVHGNPVQVEGILTFAFSTVVGNPVPILSDAEARSFAIKIIEPVFPPGGAPGTEVKVQLGVGLDGSVNGVSNPYNVPTPLFMAAYSAVRQWQFRPYVRNGKPNVFGADIIFHTK